MYLYITYIHRIRLIEIKKRMQRHMNEYINDIKVAYTVPLAYKIACESSEIFPI